MQQIGAEGPLRFSRGVPSGIDGDASRFSPDWNVDPLEDDQGGDRPVTTTCRRLVRLAITASEVGARFAREGLAQDPATWMLTPRAAFGGALPVVACQTLDGFNRAILLHGLGFGLDGHADDLDDLLAEADDHPYAPEGTGCVLPFPGTVRQQLLTCWVDAERCGQRLFAFLAVVTRRPADLVDRVAERFGAAAAAQASYRVGFDETAPLATAMISQAMADTLMLVADDPTSPLAAGLDFVVEQRFDA